MLDWRLKAFKHWQKMPEPNWAKLNIDTINYQDISLFFGAQDQRERA